MTPSVALDVGRLRGVNAPLWRKRGKHAINGRTAERLKRQALRGVNRQPFTVRTCYIQSYTRAFIITAEIAKNFLKKTIDNSINM